MTLVDETSRIAGRFLAARRAAAGLDAYPGDLPADLAEAYAIQDAAIAGWGRPVIGWKVGRVAEPLLGRFGTDRLAGPIFHQAHDGAVMPVFAEGFAAGEAEFLLRIGAAPPPGKTDFTLAETADLIDAVHAGIEIASSPLGAINEIGPIAVVSDFGNNNGLVVGPAIPDWRESGFEQWEVTCRIGGELVGTGRAEAFPDGAIGAARFLFELMARRGIALSPGQWISSGAVTGVHRAHPGEAVAASFNGGHEVACTLVAAVPEA
ncbi:MAG TPA: 2-keto-4-pentenoate hydratase [Allosphingosinicella sp.]|nr:2-keto-4-pentenoate hydratase [Allosphingosinicella sp.]